MPEYLAPGVYIEETSFRSKSIEGVSTTTTGFIGPTRYGPLDLEPDIITGLGEFERVYGDRQQMAFAGAGTLHNYLWHAVRSFFEEGGKRLYLARVFKPIKSVVPGVPDEQAEYVPPPDAIQDETRKKTDGTNYDDGHARAWLPSAPADDTPGARANKVLVRARFPGAILDNARVRFALRVGQDLLGVDGDAKPQISSALFDGDVVWIGKSATPPPPPPVGPPPDPTNDLAKAVKDLKTNFPDAAKRLADRLVDVAQSKALALESAALATASAVRAAKAVSSARSANAQVAASRADQMQRAADEAEGDAIIARAAAETIKASATATQPEKNQAEDLAAAAETSANDAKTAAAAAKAAATTAQTAAGDAQTAATAAQTAASDAQTAATAARQDATELAAQMKLALVEPAPPAPPAATKALGQLYLARFNATTQVFEFRPSQPADPIQIGDLKPDEEEVRGVTLTVTLVDSDGTPQVWSDLAFDPGHRRGGAADSITDVFAAKPSNLAQARVLPIVILSGSGLADGLKLVQTVFDSIDAVKNNANVALDSLADQSYEVTTMLDGGNDGQRPGSSEYEGKADDTANIKTGLKAFEDIEDISIVAAPGCTYGFENEFGSNAAAINNLLISHAERMRYRIAVLDSGNGQSIAQIRALRAKMDSKYAALYYPWVRVLDPVTRREIYLPPSGFVAGIYARNDINRAVWKAPANEVVNGALGFEILLNKSQQDVLNPEGINCFRFFEGRGFRLWGARTISSDPEWKYVNLRRYFIYLERSIDRGTQWAVFEPNGEALWANVRRTIEDFMFNEWQMGALLGDKPEKAYFVRCDRSTMTQNDLDNGRLVCLIGVAPLRPAEFVIFRIGQWTGDRKV